MRADIKIAVDLPWGLGVPSTKAKAAFVEPMLLYPKAACPKGPGGLMSSNWTDTGRSASKPMGGRSSLA
jgi:hypothetical protein